MKNITCYFVILSVLTCSFFTSCKSDPSSKKDNTQNETEFTKTIPPAEFLELYKAHPGAVMADVRTNKEFYAGRIVPEAVNIDYHGPDFIQEIASLDRDQPLFIYCYSGGRSSKAAYKMRQIGIKKIYECEGGYARWEKEFGAK